MRPPLSDRRASVPVRKEATVRSNLRFDEPAFTMSAENQNENPPAQPVPANIAPAAPSSVTERLLQRPPSMVSVMCPMGLTPYAIEGLSLTDPLFARVTYRPE